MGAVHFGRLVGPVGFTRIVAIKRLHAAFASDPEAVAMFLDEARIAARIHHPNVVGMHDVVEAEGEIFLVMDYVAGVSLSALTRLLHGTRLPVEVAVAVMVGVLHGLHAAHEAKSASGESLAIVHRDVSPPNILIGADGVARVIDFGIAKATERIHATRDNELRGKILYMAPEQLERLPVDRRTDVYSASVVLWELLTGRRYVDAEDASPAAKIAAVLEMRPSPPSGWAGALPRELDEVVLRGLSPDPDDRWTTALEMAAALEAALTPSSQRAVAAFIAEAAGELLGERASALREIEAAPDVEARPSTSALATSIEPARKGRDVRLVVGAVVLGAAILAWMGGTRRARPSTSLVERAVASVPVPILASAPALEAASADPPRASAAVVASPPVAPWRAAASARPARSPCDPPYTMDHGIRVPKRECL
jgi:serine/threonine-protein kinase